MQHEINIASLAEALQRKRDAEGLSVRAAAEQMEKVSSSTLSRIERGNLPDLDTYMRICRWLDVPPSHFAVKPVAQGDGARESVLEKEDIIVHLRADKLLTPATREALITMIEVTYAAARRNLLPDETQQLTSPSGI
ncbi:transcriptional regulator with XRE-family HTH domain [Hymenobacter luteus]|uniref:Transcriptional regulator with XRE-family HTH domain n=2 Tax=Hymenobacter TaxID=89966 RepID=A0A7W9WE77_9BACT|nr:MULTISPECIES: helix-turn-helix transcriptional regulator [Hymenobacter]MBB4603470.1 transcriptional regulator with XRE-family HTH domain [Hymenobacter latericoloratus]MBB6061176.1 transcriptional regulator with XRE-family HTH domain [Hymenobacter luteus]